MNENELSKQIVEAALSVHRKIGPGLLESIYEECLSKELIKCGLHIERQKNIHLEYDGIILTNAFRADIIVENKVLIELKSVEQVKDIHYLQTYSYLKILNFKLGLLINFNVSLIKDGVKRVVNKM